MTLPRPPRASGFNQRHRREFKAWLIEQLESSYEPTADDILRDVQMQNDDAFNAAMSQHVGRHRKRARVMLAVRSRNLDEIERLTGNDIKLWRLALRAALTQHKVGRAPGESRPRDLTDTERQARFDALEELDLIRYIIRRHYSRFKGSEAIAVEVAADRAGITREQLRRFRKKYGSAIPHV